MISVLYIEIRDTVHTVTFRGHKMNQYWSAKRAVLVTLRTSTGQRSEQYWSHCGPVLVTIINQYWSDE